MVLKLMESWYTKLMKKLYSLVASLLLFMNISYATDELSIEKQLVGIVGAISGTVKTGQRDLKAGDKIYLNETIYAGEGSGTQILLLDQSTFTIGSDSEVVMDTFIFDPATNDGKIVASVKQGSLKVISGLISKKNPDSLTVEVPEGTLGSRGTEFQTIVSNKKTDTLLIGPGKNNTLGLRPGAVLVGNRFGQTMLDNPYSVASMRQGKAPGKAKQITNQQLKKFNKKMRALKVAKLTGASKEEKKALKKKIRKELKAQGFEKEEIKAIIKENIKIDKEKRIVLLQERGEDVSEIIGTGDIENEVDASINNDALNEDNPDFDPVIDNKEDKKEKATKNKKGKKKKATKNKKGKKKKATKNKKGKKKKVVKKKGSTKKKAVKKKTTKKKKVVKKKAAKKKKVVKKKKVKKKKIVKKKVAKKKKIVKKKIAKKKKKRKKKRKNKK